MSSDSENDPEYVPTTPKNNSDSDTDHERSVKRIRTSPRKLTAEEEEALKKTEQDRAWQQFQSTSVQKPQHPTEFVQVQKRYRFAGEDVLEVVQVPADSEDAKRWPLSSEPGPSNHISPDSVGNPMSSSSAAPVHTINQNSKPKARGLRKPKLILPSLPTSSQPKVKKLSTLDKSSIDWKTHLNHDGAATKDELEANRRSGGYLGKTEFLHRVSERKDHILEETHAKKRRR